jgi:Na+-transporting NADH:ubiquinone oxidoreductase subunit NqrD
MRGDHLIVDCGVYRHHAIDCGDGAVVHFPGPIVEKISLSIRVDTYERFAKGRTVRIREYGQRLNPDETVRRALAMVGLTGYDLITNNCEHLASSCVTGEPESRQVERAVAGTGAVIAALAASGYSHDLLKSIGSVRDLSAAGIMSGLRQSGELVDGGVLAGLYLLGLVPASAGVACVFFATKAKPHLTERERRARAIARVVAIIASAATGLVEIQILSSLGTVKGLSAPGIASGLAAVGRLNDGGMVAGTGLLVAAPALVVGTAAWLAYQFTLRWLAEDGHVELPPPAPA